MKAELELIRYASDIPERSQRITAIAERRAAWLSVPIEAIVKQFSAEASP